MTPQEAKEWLVAIAKKYIHGGDEGFDKRRKKAIDTAISALEKQIPKKPVVPLDSIREQHECPVCPHRVYKTQQYCDKCGQKLDWSDT